jgi:hypothetical protein
LIPGSVLRELKECFLEAYDENADGRIEIGEVYSERFSFFVFFSYINIYLVSRNLTDRRKFSFSFS